MKITKDEIEHGEPFRLTLPNGLVALIETKRDEDTGAPWKEHDGHGPVTDWTSRPKRAGERIINTDRGSHRFYDFAAAMKQAKKEGWGLGADELAALAAKLGRAPTAGEVTAASVERDFAFCYGWANDEWEWLGGDCHPPGSGRGGDRRAFPVGSRKRRRLLEGNRG